MLLALFFPLKGICVLVLFLGIQSSIKEASKGLKQESANFAQEVQSKIRERRTSISQRSQEKEAEIRAHQEYVIQSIRNISRQLEGSFERFRVTHEEIEAWMSKHVAEAEKRIEEMDKVYWDSVYRRQEELEAERKRHSKILQKEATSPQESITPIDLPLICDDAKWLKDHTKPEYKE